MSIRGCGQSGRSVILVAGGIALSTTACSVSDDVAPFPPPAPVMWSSITSQPPQEGAGVFRLPDRPARAAQCDSGMCFESVPPVAVMVSAEIAFGGASESSTRYKQVRRGPCPIKKERRPDWGGVPQR